MAEIRILYFANIAEKVGRREQTLEVPQPITARQLQELLAAAHESVGEMFFHCRVAVNEEFVGPEHPIEGGDTVALIPPVSGG